MLQIIILSESSLPHARWQQCHIGAAGLSTTSTRPDHGGARPSFLSGTVQQSVQGDSKLQQHNRSRSSSREQCPSLWTVHTKQATLCDAGSVAEDSSHRGQQSLAGTSGSGKPKGPGVPRQLLVVLFYPPCTPGRVSVRPMTVLGSRRWIGLAGWRRPSCSSTYLLSRRLGLMGAREWALTSHATLPPLESAPFLLRLLCA